MPPVWLKHGIHSALNLHDLSPATGLEGAAALDVKQSDRVITMHRHRIDPYAGAVSHISSSVSVQKRLAFKRLTFRMAEFPPRWIWRYGYG